MNIDLKTLATVIGIVASLAGIIGTWSTVQYRLDEVEVRQVELSKEIKRVEEALHEKGDEVKCLICDTNNIPCPGC
jgi:sensor domain CHASE-containing protein